MLSEFIRAAQEHPQQLAKEDEAAIIQESISWAKSIRTRVANKAANPAIYPPDERPISIFMAGTPGAGKTEWRKSFFKAINFKILQIDPDEFRCALPYYIGSNSHLFQIATSLITERVLDRAFEKNISFVLDGTLSSWGPAYKNIKRSLDRGRKVQIFFIHQDPCASWEFVEAREKIEGRRLTPDAFISSYFGCRDVITKILSEPAFAAAISDKTLAVDVFSKPTASHPDGVWTPRVNTSTFKGVVTNDFTEWELREIISAPTA